MTKWGTDYHIVWTSEHLSAWGHGSPRELNRTHTLDRVSYMLWSLKDQRLSELPEEIQSSRETHESHSGSKRTCRLWFEIQSERRAALRHMTESLWIQHHSSSNTGFTLSAHLRGKMFNTETDIYAGRRAGCLLRFSDKWGLQVQSHGFTLRWQLLIGNFDSFIYNDI